MLIIKGTIQRELVIFSRVTIKLNMSDRKQEHCESTQDVVCGRRCSFIILVPLSIHNIYILVCARQHAVKSVELFSIKTTNTERNIQFQDEK